MQTSGILFIFWLLMAICGIPQFRNDVAKTFGIDKEDEGELKYSHQIISLITYPLIVLMFFLNCIAEITSIESKALSQKVCSNYNSYSTYLSFI